MVVQETQNIREQYSRQAQILAQAKQQTQASQFSPTQLRQLSRQGGVRQAQVKLQVEKAKAIEELSSKEKQLAQASQEFEAVAKPYEAALKDKADYELALRLYRRGHSAVWFKKSNPRAYSYWKQLLREGEDAREEQEAVIKEMQSKLAPGENLVTKEYGSGVIKKLKIVGIDSKKIGTVVPLKEYNQALEKAYYASKDIIIPESVQSKVITEKPQVINTDSMQRYSQVSSGSKPMTVTISTATNPLASSKPEYPEELKDLEKLNERIRKLDEENLKLNTKYERGEIKANVYESQFERNVNEIETIQNEEQRMIDEFNARREKVLAETRNAQFVDYDMLHSNLFSLRENIEDASKMNMFKTSPFAAITISTAKNIARDTTNLVSSTIFGLQKPRTLETYEQQKIFLERDQFLPKKFPLVNALASMVKYAPAISEESKAYNKYLDEAKRLQDFIKQKDVELESGKITQLEYAESTSPKIARMNAIQSQFTTPAIEGYKRGEQLPAFAANVATSAAMFIPGAGYVAIAEGGFATEDALNRGDVKGALLTSVPLIAGGLLGIAPATKVFKDSGAVRLISRAGRAGLTTSIGIASGVSAYQTAKQVTNDEKFATKAAIFGGLGSVSPFVAKGTYDVVKQGLRVKPYEMVEESPKITAQERKMMARSGKTIMQDEWVTRETPKGTEYIAFGESPRGQVIYVKTPGKRTVYISNFQLWKAKLGITPKPIYVGKPTGGSITIKGSDAFGVKKAHGYSDSITFTQTRPQALAGREKVISRLKLLEEYTPMEAANAVKYTPARAEKVGIKVHTIVGILRPGKELKGFAYGTETRRGLSQPTILKPAKGVKIEAGYNTFEFGTEKIKTKPPSTIKRIFREELEKQPSFQEGRELYKSYRTYLSKNGITATTKQTNIVYDLTKTKVVKSLFGETTQYAQKSISNQILPRTNAKYLFLKSKNIVVQPRLKAVTQMGGELKTGKEIFQPVIKTKVPRAFPKTIEYNPKTGQLVESFPPTVSRIRKGENFEWLRVMFDKPSKPITNKFKGFKVQPTEKKYPTIVGGKGDTGAYTGLNQYEKTQDTGVALKMRTLPSLTAIPSIKSDVNQVPIVKETTIQKPTILFKVSQNMNLIPQEKTELELQTNLRQELTPKVEIKEEIIPKVNLRQNVNPVLQIQPALKITPAVTVNPTVSPRPTIRPTPRTGIGIIGGGGEISIKRIVKKLIGSEGYKTFVISKGKKQILSGVRTRKEALKFGESVALKKAIATFGIEKANRVVIGDIRDIGEYTPSEKIFRSYRIKKGKRISLKDIFIQKTRMEGGLKSGRLSFRGERKEVTKARRNARVKGIPWW